MPSRRRSSSVAGTKRTYSNRESWPLPEKAHARPPLSHRNSTTNYSSREVVISPGRTSRFVEGSMNDRASQVPPSPYLDGEYYLDEQGDRKIITPRKLKRYASNNEYSNGSRYVNGSEGDRSESSRQSSIFRFGKAIAANLNPSNWKLWSKTQPPVVYDEEAEQQRILDERAVKARRLYKELKESGHFPLTNATLTAFQDEENERGRQHLKHDSGVAFQGKSMVGPYQRESSVPNRRGHSRRNSVEMSMSVEQKRLGKVYLEPNHPAFSRGPSPAISNFSESGRRSASVQRSVSGRSTTSVGRAASAQLTRGESVRLHSDKKRGFKRASFTNIKNAFKGGDSNNTSLVASGTTTARRMPSKADLQKQQKLVNRVSDLEGKLEAARRQLNQSLGEPLPLAPPIRSVGKNTRFVPGALSTLPSERLLAGYVDPEQTDESFYIGRALSVDSAQLSPATPNSANFPSQDSILQDSLMQSVEIDDTLGNYPEAASTPKQRKPSNIKLKDEPTPTAQAPKKTSPKGKKVSPRALRKRKTAFVGHADDGGLYKPGKESSSETGSSEFSKRGGLRKRAVAGPVKKGLRLATQKPAAAIEPAKKDGVIGSRVVKKRGASGRQSVSPPPDVQSPPASPSPSPPAETHYKDANPANKKSTLNLAEHVDANEEEGDDQNYTVHGEDDEDDVDVPPMPKLPTSIRLANGEVIRPTPAAYQKIHKKEGVIKQAEKKQGLTRAAESFEWPADVF
ncbi:hypothetical protein HYFRA_00009084 [Hymenoscyphus fraxineus]|uniref:Nuclear RNA binding protein n=1 Tax=Hymenoscyphus fraxineus TaxID=746836 RepID=A0A9N9KXL5_9HELO|nr:hypothetical protein HYFRA_00009084 [Hymenoscyphus fraxineus]